MKKRDLGKEKAMQKRDRGTKAQSVKRQAIVEKGQRHEGTKGIGKEAIGKQRPAFSAKRVYSTLTPNPELN